MIRGALLSLMLASCAGGSLGELVMGGGDLEPPGDRWRALPSPTTDDLAAVAFLDDSHGFVVGDRGTLLETTDGGESWVATDSGTGERLRSIAFAAAPNHQVGYIVGDNGTVLFSHDGAGQRWEDRSLEIAKTLLDVSDAGLAGVDVDETGHGQLYDVLVGDPIDSGIPATFQAVYADGLAAGIALDGETSHGVIYRLGATGSWERLWRHERDGYFFRAVAADEKTIVACGYPSSRFPGELVLVSRDGGERWAIFENEINRAPLHDCDFAPSGAIFAVGDGGSIIRSDNGGETWSSSRVPVAGSGALNGVAAAGDRVFAVGDRGTILVLDRD